MNLGKAYKQLFELQDVLFKQTLDPNTEAKDKAACARAWEQLEERKRILRGRPMPGSLRPSENRNKQRRTFLLPMPDQPETKPKASAPDVDEDKEQKASQHG